MRALIMDDIAIAKIRRLIELAKNNSVSYERLISIAAGDVGNVILYDPTKKEWPVSWLEQIARQTIQLTGYTVTYTIEFHKPDVECRHMSVGLVDGKPKMAPSFVSVKTLMGLFEFHSDTPFNVMTWLENQRDGTFAVNVLEPTDGDMSKLKRNPS